jgi:magnesium-transporting ATPase (P-type)
VVLDDGSIDWENFTFKATFTFYLLFNGLIPLDLSVTLMITKLFKVWQMGRDGYMYDYEKAYVEGEEIGCQVRNMTLLEDLARITHLFCDKTGTLTKNELVFRSLAIGKNRFDMKDQTKDGHD